MSEMTKENTGTMNQTLSDLEVAAAENIKGGPKKIFIGGLSVAATNELPDLEAQDDVKGGREHVLLARQVQVP